MGRSSEELAVMSPKRFRVRRDPKISESFQSRQPIHAISLYFTQRPQQCRLRGNRMQIRRQIS